MQDVTGKNLEIGDKIVLEQCFDSVWVNVPMPLDYTCGCGIYVHPSRQNHKALHCSDCRYHQAPTLTPQKYEQ